MTYALQNSKAAPAIAMSYLSVVWSLLSGILVFKEYPNATSLVGAALICRYCCCAEPSALGMSGWQMPLLALQTP